MKKFLLIVCTLSIFACGGRDDSVRRFHAGSAELLPDILGAEQEPHLAGAERGCGIAVQHQPAAVCGGIFLCFPCDQGIHAVKKTMTRSVSRM